MEFRFNRKTRHLECTQCTHYPEGLETKGALKVEWVGSQTCLPEFATEPAWSPSNTTKVGSNYQRYDLRVYFRHKDNYKYKPESYYQVGWPREEL